PTGGGKTEAYLGLAAFTIASRRLAALEQGGPQGGMSVLSRYTLRLLTIQQFRRALVLVAACEYLRNIGQGNVRGWRPEGLAPTNTSTWGTERFSIGLWVGGKVTPNGLFDFWIKGQEVPGALGILRGADGEGEPAQVLSCPACSSILAVAPEGFVPN